MATTKHTIVALVEDKPGVLNRVASMFRRRGFNIESLAVGHSEQAGVSRMTIVVDGATAVLDQVTKQLYKIVDVVKVSDFAESELVARELALIKVKATPSTRGEIIQIADIFRANIIDVAPDSLIIEVTGDTDKVDSLFRLLKGFGVRELSRTGRLAMARGPAGTLGVEAESRPSRGKGRKQEGGS
ncbi:MAG: acetolactate synthase small subunit [Chloroflexi bacterium]|nr:acetolactate synthase small subunit [Chloroflexota bacterium]